MFDVDKETAKSCYFRIFLHITNLTFYRIIEVSRKPLLFRFIEFIGVLRHMQRYFSHICDGTDVQAD